MTADGEYPAKELHDIVAGILAIDVGWAGGLGNTFAKNHGELSGDRSLDCGLAVSTGCFDVYHESRVFVNREGPRAGKLITSKSEVALAVFLFRLLGRLQLIGTVPAIDWYSYATQFSN